MTIEALLLNPWAILVITAWTLPWKGYALWRAAQRREQWWFVALLILNTLAILEIIYIFAFSRKPVQPAQVPAK